MAKIGTYKAKRLFPITPLDLVYPFKGLLIKDIATYTIYGISRIGNDPAIFKYACSSF